MADEHQPERNVNIESHVHDDTTPSPSFRSVVLVGVLALLGAVLVNIATSQLPQRLQPYLWLAWPLAVLVMAASIWVAYRQRRSAGSSVAFSGNLEHRKLHIFLCHASQDKPAVRQLYRRLLADGFAPWLDEEQLLAGQDWNLEITKAMQTTDVVIVCLSQRSTTKAGYVQKEIKFALDVADMQPEGTIFLIPLRLEECNVPDRLQPWHWVNLFEDRGYEKLLRALRARAEQ